MPERNSAPTPRSSVTFRKGSADEPLHRGIASRSARDAVGSVLSSGQVAVRDLERYYRLVDRTLQSVIFSNAEASAIVDACNGTIWDTFSLFDGLALSIEDAISLEQIDVKWGIDGERLLAKVRALEPVQHLAIVDAIERFWIAGHGTDREDILRQVGLVRCKRGVLTPKPDHDQEPPG